MARLSEEQIQNIRSNNLVMFNYLRFPCDDCNLLWHPLVMSFDHTDRTSKLGNISDMRTGSPEVFSNEIAKCEIVCLNCHQMREYIRDINARSFTESKKSRHKFYERLIPYLAGGALLRKDAYNFVEVGTR